MFYLISKKGKQLKNENGSGIQDLLLGKLVQVNYKACILNEENNKVEYITGQTSGIITRYIFDDSSRYCYCLVSVIDNKEYRIRSHEITQIEILEKDVFVEITSHEHKKIPDNIPYQFITYKFSSA